VDYLRVMPVIQAQSPTVGNKATTFLVVWKKSAHSLIKGIFA